MNPFRPETLRHIVTALALAGCAGTTQPPAAPAPDTGIPPRQSRHTEADVRFMSDMIHHHAQALVMAGLAPTHGASKPIQIMCERIINAQQDEILFMQNWLRDQGEPVTQVDTAGALGRMEHGAGHEMDHALMPGMLTPEQLMELDQARGTEFDRLFLKYMIQHHKGAVQMVDRLVQTPGAAQDDVVFKLVSDISADQTSEIDRMSTMLTLMELTAPEAN